MPLAESPTEPPDRWIGALLAKTYRVKRLLGEGGMGAVYEAEHTRLPRSFAVKVLGDASFKQPIAEARFRREAEIACRLKHRHIVEVVDYNVASSGQPYLVMELLEGEDLSARLGRMGPLPIELAASITHQVAAALATAHQEGVIHRDLKPQNIFLCRQADRDDFVKVLDFGISKIVGSGSSLTGEQAIMGTPWYMAPEQARGMSAEVDHRSDIFALGAILYQMLAGRVPFAGETALATLYAVIHEEPPALSTLRPGIPVALEAAVMRALAKMPEDRYPHVGELSAAVVEAAELSLDITGEHLRITRPPIAGGAGPPITGPVPRSSPGTTVATGETMVAPTGAQVPPRSRRRLALVAGGLLLLAAGGVVGVGALTGERGAAVSAPAPDARPLDRTRASDAPERRADTAPDAISAGDRKPARGPVKKAWIRPPVVKADVPTEPKPVEAKPAAKPKLPAKPEPKLPAKPEPKPKAKSKDWIVKPEI